MARAIPKRSRWSEHRSRTARRTCSVRVTYAVITRPEFAPLPATAQDISEGPRRRELVEEQAVRHLGETDETGCRWVKRRTGASGCTVVVMGISTRSAAPGRCAGKGAISWRPGD
jgi:hypothetical protein